MIRNWPAPMGAAWIHASSVGEVGAAEVLWRALDGPRFISTDTEGGLVRARRFTALSDRLPLDLPWMLAPLWAQARPSVVVFVEGTFWPSLARLASQQGVAVLRVSCKAGARTRRMPKPILRRLWSPTTAVAARSESEASFLRGVHGCEVVALGNLKAGIRPSPSALHWSRPFWAGVSLRGAELRHTLEARHALPDHQLLWAPRHPELAHASFLHGLRWARRSDLGDTVPADLDVVWLDTVGELPSLLQGAAAAFIGGTFDGNVGGHSPREAQAWGVPVVAGPERADPLAFSGARLANLPQDLAAALRTAMLAPPMPVEASSVGTRVADFVRANQRGPSPERAPRPWARSLRLPYLAGWTALRALSTLRTSVRIGVPVVSVGSSNARSPGRTTTVLWLVERLQQRGHQVGVALRGYHRTQRGLRGSWDDAEASALGDEGALLARTGALVAASEQRSKAAMALAERGCTVVVLDDGRQCPWLHRDLEIEIVDGRYPKARGLLPAGEAREPWPMAADVCLVHHPQPDSVGIPVHRTPGPWRRGGVPCEPPDGPVAVWLGVGHPEEFLEQLELPIAKRRIDADHAAPFGLEAWAGGLPIVCTSKDWARLSGPLADTTWHRGVQLEVTDDSWLTL